MRCALLAVTLVVASAAMGDELVLSDFESLEGWKGLEPDTETVKEGKQSGFWADASEVHSVSLAGPWDWSEFGGIRLWMHSSVANGQRIDLIAHSKTVGFDYFQYYFRLDWTGWKELVIPFYVFGKVRQPAGWQKIDSFAISASWGDTPRKDTILRLDDLRLTDDIPSPLRDPMTNRELIEALDLERDGLEAVKDLAEEQKWDEAAGALLDYYRDLREVRYFLDPNEEQPAPNPKYNTSRADHVLKHEFSFYNSDYYFVGEQIDWEADPVSDREWPTALNRHGDLRTLARTWWYTGEDKYAQEAANFLHQWIAAARVPNFSARNVYWSTLNTASRLSAWPEAWIRLLRADGFPDEVRLEMLKMFWHQAEYLTINHGGGNWLVSESKALLGVALLFPEFSRAQVWETEALERLNREIAHQTYPGGAQFELTPHYHLVCVGGFTQPLDLMRVNGRDMPAEYQERLEKMYEYIMYVSKPDRHIPMLNDADHNNIQSLMRKGASLFEREDMQFIGADGAEGAQPEQVSVAFTWAGQYVMRSDWSSEALYLLFDAGPFGAGHQHEDKLNVDIHAYGSDLILDPGRFTYAGNEWRRFFQKSVGHNLILVDGGGQMRRASPRETFNATGPMPVTWASTADFDYARGKYDEGFDAEGQPQVTHTRAIWFVKPKYWVIADFLRPEDGDEHEYQMLWHFGAGEATVEENAVRFVGETAGIQVAPQMPGPEAQIIVGQEEPPQGWISYWYGKKQPAPTAIYKFAAAAADIPTVLYPFPGSQAPAVEVTNLEVEGGVGVTVQGEDGWRAIIFAAPDAEVVRWNAFESDAEAFALHYAPNNELTAAYLASGSYLRGPDGLSIENAQRQASAEWRPD